jgi:hypothetical protein
MFQPTVAASRNTPRRNRVARSMSPVEYATGRRLPKSLADREIDRAEADRTFAAPEFIAPR